MGRDITQQTFALTIAASASLSDAAVIGGLVPIGVVMSAAWTAADLAFEVSHDGGTTFKPLYGMDAEVAVSVAAANRYVALDPSKFVGINALKIRSGSSGSPV